MADTRDEFSERLSAVEKDTAWLRQRVWDGTGNLHDRVHVLEDRNGDRVHEISILQSRQAKVERVLGLDGYGERNVVNDLRDALDSIEKIKDGVISTKDFQALMGDVNAMKRNLITREEFQTLQHDVEDLKKRGQAQITFANVIQMSVITSAISILVNFIANRVVP